MRRSLSFSEIERFILSDYDSGKALAERGLINKEWFTLEIELKDRMRIRLMKTPYDEREELYEMNEELRNQLDHWFRFEEEFNTESTPF